MLDGLSSTPQISEETKSRVTDSLKDLTKLYTKLLNLDKNYMEKIASNDKYRIEKAAQIYFETNLTPSEYFLQNQPKPLINKENIDIFEITTDIDILRERIKKRTKIMIQDGIIDEVISLEKHYTRAPNAMKSIGISETLDYLDSKISKKELEELISIHTAQLAKRQRTFNKSQFQNIHKEKLSNMKELILSSIS
jgi:tRNA dimethylallyltransferase